MISGSWTFDFISRDADQITSSKFREKLRVMKDAINAAIAKRNQLTHQINSSEGTLASLRRRRNFWFWLPFSEKLFKDRNQKLDAQIQSASSALDSLLRDREKLAVTMSVKLSGEASKAYQTLVHAFQNLMRCECLWDVMRAKATNRKVERTAADSAIDIRKVAFDQQQFSILRSEHQPMHLQNGNRADLYFYPAVIIMGTGTENVGLIDYGDVKVTYSPTKFIETNKVPRDTSVIGQTWYKVNKDGSPDRRFANNYQIPIVQYGEFQLLSASGLNEAYMVSNPQAAEAFCHALEHYKAVFRR